VFNSNEFLYVDWAGRRPSRRTGQSRM